MTPRRSARDPVRLVLYTRANCPLCDEMKAGVSRLPVPVRFEEVDVDSDPELVRRFGYSVPVLELGGRVVCEGRLDSGALARELERATTAPGEEAR